MTILKTDTVSGIGTEGTVFEGDITFDSLNYMTLPKGTTAQSNRGVGLYGGGNAPGADPTAQIASILIQSMGNSVDWGDQGGTTQHSAGACSDSHGGIS